MSWNPNSSPPAVVVQKSMNDTIVPPAAETHNRALDVRRDTETFKNFSITLTDIDNAIAEHLSKNISIEVVAEGKDVKVPIIYADPERWKSMTADGVIRDGQGKLQLPVFAFTRTSFEKNQNMMTMNRYLAYPVISRYSDVNKYDSLDVLKQADKRKTNDVYLVTLPDHITVEYKCIAQTHFTSQANSIVEKINFATEEYWGDKNRFKFRTYASSYTFTTENPSDDDRIVKAEFNLTVQAYLLPEYFEDRKSTTQRCLTPRSFIIGTELMSTGGNTMELKSSNFLGDMHLYSDNGTVWMVLLDADGVPYSVQRGSSGSEKIELFSSPGNLWNIYVNNSGSLYTTSVTSSVVDMTTAKQYINMYSVLGEKWSLSVDNTGSIVTSRIV